MEVDGAVFHEHLELLAYSGSYLRLASSKNQKLEFEEVVVHSRMNPMVVASRCWSGPFSLGVQLAHQPLTVGSRSPCQPLLLLR